MQEAYSTKIHFGSSAMIECECQNNKLAVNAEDRGRRLSF